MTSPFERRDAEQGDEADPNPWLDALLEEVLGGQGPPDLKQQILTRWKAQSRAEVASKRDESQVPPPLVVAPTRRVVHQRLGGRRRISPVWHVMAGACLLALMTTGILYWQTRPIPHHSPIVLGGTRPAERELRRSMGPRPTPIDAVRRPPADDATSPEVRSDVEEDGSVSEETSEANREAPPDPVESADAPSGATRLADATIVQQINEQLSARWARMGVVSATPIADEDWCNRTFSQLIGRAPRSQELREFLGEPAADRRVGLVNRLLGDAYAQELAAHWSRNCTDWWLDESAGESRAFRTGLQTHLASEFAAGRPLNQVLLDLIAATGSNDPSRPDFRGATNYLLALSDRATAADVTAQICRVTLGQRVGCAQCHDPHQGQISQQNFWQLTAALQRFQIDVFRPGRGRVRDVESERAATLKFQNAAGESVEAVPAGLDGALLVASPNQSERAQLAQQLVDSDDFPRAMVNRFWESLLQFGFTFPVDDMGAHNPVSHPELVALLSEQFALHEYDLRQLLRWITLSDAFNRSEVIIAANDKDAPVEGGQALFSRYYHRPSLYSHASQGLEQLAAGQSPQVVYSGNADHLEELFSRRYGDPTRSRSNERPAETGSDRMGQLLPSHYLARIRALAVDRLTFEQQFEHAYLMVLGRRPTDVEQSHAGAIYKAAGEDAVVALERVVWTLINSQS